MTRQTTSSGRAARFGFVLLAAVVAGCSTATVPFDYPKTESTAVPPSDTTRLGRTVAEWSEAHDGESGFFALDYGMDALGARLRLMEEADQTIDAQYFLIKGDSAGALFAGQLMRAADRGVRVRFLIDDVFTSAGLDPELSLMNSHPNIEIRMFNPVSRSGSQAFNFLADFKRANRRMHNKSFTVDSVFTIVGGRNIANEYFDIGSDVEFADFEVIGFGPVAADVSETFDIFWNHELAVPMEAFGGATDEADFEAFRQELEAELDQGEDGPYAQAMNTPFIKDLVDERIEPIVAHVDVVTDRPEKLQNEVGENYTELAGALRRAIEAAEDEVILVTPYFVPGQDGVDFFTDIRAKGVRVVVLTNSLASTNHIAVHSGYAPYRRALLEGDVEIFEVKVDSPAVAGSSEADVPERLTLHTKAVIIDRKTMFVGSLNLDPRSVDLNTEMGLFLDSPEAAGGFAEQLDIDLPVYTYRVELDDPGPLAWYYDGEKGTTKKTSEPDVSLGRAFKADFYRLLPLENQL